MFSQYPKLFIFLSALILALTLYQLSVKSSSKPIEQSTEQKDNYPINNQKIESRQQGKIESH